jgi:hypothetical protein
MAYITVDTTRVRMNIPSEYRTIGVTLDVGSRIISFKLPKQISSVFNLANAVVAIEYVRSSDNAGGRDNLTRTDEDEDFLYFTWEPDAPVFYEDGVISAHLCATITEDTKVVREWHTVPSMFMVLASKEAGMQLERYYLGKDDFLTEEEARAIAREVYEEAKERLNEQ